MVRVSKKEFYEAVANGDVVVSVENPDTAVFRQRHGRVVGKSIDDLNSDKTEYFLN